MNESQADYREQLPSMPKFSMEKLFQGISGLASIFGMVIIAVDYFKGFQFTSKLFAISIVTVNISLLILTYLREKNKLNRYAQSVFFVHYVNHMVRDIISESKRTKSSQMSREDLENLLSAVAECFSIICGSRCRATLKEMLKDETVKTVARDRTSKIDIKRSDFEQRHPLIDNTDYYKLWHALDGCSRFYQSNDLVSEWKKGRYRNSSFEIYGEAPKAIIDFNGREYSLPIGNGLKVAIPSVRLFVRWALPYKSTLVLPIRYISSFTPPKTKAKKRNNRKDHWLYWGFLCIDNRHRRVFNDNFSPELGAAFADVLFVLFQAMEEYVVDN